MPISALGGDQAPAKIAALMWGIFAGPIAWAADEGISHAIVQHACSTGAHFWLHVITGLALLLASSGLVIALMQTASIPGPHIEDGGSRRDWTWWTARYAVASSTFFIVVLLAQTVPRFILSPCD
jgi:hypothetical protein